MHASPALKLLARPATAFFVGKRRPLAELSFWHRLWVKWCYRGSGWASDYSVEAVGIYTHREDAIKAASIPGGFYHELPVNASLPDVPCGFREHAFPLSSRNGHRSNMEAVPCDMLLELAARVDRLASQ